jgi:cytochrome c5
MKTLLMTARILTTISVLTLLVVASAQAQAGTVLSANVPFSFAAGGTTLPAGTYQFKFRPNDETLLINGGKAGELKLHAIAQLAGASLFKDTGLVFDAFEGRHVLSEVWIPGEGGVLVNAAPKQHPHEVVVAMVSGTEPKLTGKEVYQRTCIRCHGPQGTGNPEADKFFQVAIPRLNSAHVQTKSDKDLKDIITQGRRNMDPVRVGQGPLQHLLDPRSVGAVIDYLRTFKQS